MNRLRREAMGIDWMRRGELSEAVPPAYTEFIGKRLLESAK
jgi:DNA (cytosine-5)-methyltransferase 1